MMKDIFLHPVLAFNFNDQFDCYGIIKAAKNANSPVILLVSEKAINFSSLSILTNIFNSIKKDIGSDVFIQLDHARDINLIKKAIELGFDMIMADFSDKNIECNIENTSFITELAHKYNILVEAEIGNIPVCNSLNCDSVSLESITKKEDVLYFIEQTNIDLLAISAGNLHGFCRNKPEIDINLIKQINMCSDIPLVLHGGDFYSDDILSQLIRSGIKKINIGPELRVEYLEALAFGIKNANFQTPDHRIIFELIKNKIEDHVRKKINILSYVSSHDNQYRTN